MIRAATETRDLESPRSIAMRYARSVMLARTAEMMALEKRAAAERVDDSSNDLVRQSLRLQAVEAAQVAAQWQQLVTFLEWDDADQAPR